MSRWDLFITPQRLGPLHCATVKNIPHHVHVSNHRKWHLDQACAREKFFKCMGVQMWGLNYYSVALSDFISATPEREGKRIRIYPWYQGNLAGSVNKGLDSVPFTWQHGRMWEGRSGDSRKRGTGAWHTLSGIWRKVTTLEKKCKECATDDFLNRRPLQWFSSCTTHWNPLENFVSLPVPTPQP